MRVISLLKGLTACVPSGNFGQPVRVSRNCGYGNSSFARRCQGIVEKH